MALADSKPRWYHITPDRFVIAMLRPVCVLWLSERFRWLASNQHKGWAVLIAIAFVAWSLLVMLSWFVVSLSIRAKFQFSVRSLLLLAVVVAMPSSWFAMEMNQSARQKDAVRAIALSSGWVLYDRELAVPRFLGDFRNWLGQDFFAYVSYAGTGNDAGLRCAKGLPRLRSMYVGEFDVRASMLREEFVYVHATDFPDVDFVHPNKGSRGSNLTDAGLKEIEGLAELRSLEIYYCSALTDERLESLARLPSLRYICLTPPDGVQCLDLEPSPITEVVVDRLRKAFPRCKIDYEPPPVPQISPPNPFGL